MNITREMIEDSFLRAQRLQERKEDWVKDGIELGFLDENGKPL